MSDLDPASINLGKPYSEFVEETNQTMLAHAGRWVDNHLAHCTSDTCGCSEASRDKMIDAILEVWLFTD